MVNISNINVVVCIAGLMASSMALADGSNSTINSQTTDMQGKTVLAVPQPEGTASPQMDGIGAGEGRKGVASSLQPVGASIETPDATPPTTVNGQITDIVGKPATGIRTPRTAD